jgi:hypothetical protein
VRDNNLQLTKNLNEAEKKEEGAQPAVRLRNCFTRQSQKRKDNTLGYSRLNGLKPI